MTSPTHPRFSLANQPTTLRGGRMTKWKGSAASMSPTMGTVALTVSALCFAGSADAADECGLDTGGPTTINCSAGPYLTGIDYTITDAADFTLVLNNSGILVGPVAGKGVSAENTQAAGAVTVNATSFGSIKTTGDHNHAIFAYISGANNLATAAATMAGNGMVTTSGNHDAIGVWALNEGLGNSEATLDDGTIITSGTASHGIEAHIRASGGGPSGSTGTTTATMNGGSMTVGGVGIFSSNYGQGNAIATLNYGSINSVARGLNAWVKNTASSGTATATMNDGTITISGAVGVWALNSGLGNSEAFLYGGDVSAARFGLHSTVRNASSRGSATATMTGGTVNTTGIDAYGVSAETTGTGSVEVSVSRNASVSSTGADSYGLATSIGQASATYKVEVSGTARVTGGTGDGAGIRTRSVIGSTGVIDIMSGTVGALSDRAILDLDGMTAITNGGLVTGFVDLGAGVDSFTNTGSFDVRNAVDGDANGSRETESIAVNDFGDGIDSFTNDGGTVRLLTAVDSTTTPGIERSEFINLEIFSNGGIITMMDAETGGASAVAGDTLVITQSATAGTAGTGVFESNGGSLRLDTALGGTGSISDILTVDNTMTTVGGATQVYIANAGGTGSATDDNNNGVFDEGEGILVVDVLGTSDADAFTLGGPVVAGVFSYDLERGATSGDWFLASALNGTAAVYESAPAILGGFNRMATLEQRVGQREWAGRDSDSVGSLDGSQGGWLRIHGDKFSNTPGSSISGASYDSSTWGLQAGVDFAIEPGAAGQWVLGATAQYGTTNGDVVNATGTGSIDTEGYGVGATATWYGNSGTYVDVQGQVNWLEMDVASSASGQLVDGGNATTYALSVEVGHRFEVSANSALVPQAQLTWGSVDGGSFTDTASNTVDLGSTESLTGRIGLAYEYEYSEGWLFGNRQAKGNQGHREKAYVIGNILHDFSGASSVNVNGTSLSSDSAQTWAEVGIGGSIVWDESKTLYTEGTYRRSLSNSDNEGFGLAAGLRIQF